MKSRILKSIVGLALLSALCLAGATSHTSARGAAPDKPESNGRKLEGTWRVQVTIRNCQSGAEIRKFPAMLTFAQGGTLVETTTGFPPAQRSPGHGFWRHAGGRAYTAVSEAFLFSPSNAWVGTQRLTQSIEFGGDPDEFYSNAQNEIYDTNGNLTTTGCATAVAQRFE